MTELGGGKELLGLGQGVAFVGATTIKHRSDKDTTIKTGLQRVGVAFVPNQKSCFLCGFADCLMMNL